ncbi:MAG: QueT transporter family protein [Clostridia bacterium]|nr:QueT transporter family protein [Clostridia bacterium]
MRRKFTTKALCRAGIIGALYVVLTMVFGALAYGPFQIRPAEALTILPLFYAEAVPGLYVGCVIANLLSGYGVYDILLGSLATLIAGLLTRLMGRFLKNKPLRVFLGGLFPVVVNAFMVPAVWYLAGSAEEVYFLSVLSMLVTQSVWVYALGTPLFVAVDKLSPKLGALRPVTFRKDSSRRGKGEGREEEPS